MNLLKLTGAFAKWYAASLGTFLRFQPVNVVVLIVSKVLYLITTVLARLLPIKAILLVGSPGVPRYFQAIIPPDRKNEGLAILAVAAIAAYAGSFALEAAIAKLTRTGSSRVVKRANDIVLTDQLEIANTYYDRIASVGANLTFGAVAFTILAFAAPPVLWTVSAAVLTLYTFATLVLWFGDTHRKGSLAYALVNHLGTVLSVAVVLTFICSFIVILWPFVSGGEGQVLLAIISVVLVRRLMAVLAAVVKLARALFERAPQINQLIFRSHRLEATERPDWRVLRDTYTVDDRATALRAALPAVFSGYAALAARWMNPVIAVQRQLITATDASGAETTFVERIFPLAARHRLDNETFLFGKVDPDAVGAPRAVGEFQHGPFLSQVSTCGTGMTLATRAEWPVLQATAVAQLWSVVPPKDLVSAYSTTHRFLHERLNEALVSRASLAADSASDVAVHAAFLADLPNLRTRLEQLPLVLVNPDISVANVLTHQTGRVVVLDWSRWAIEPMGAANAPRNTERLAGLLAQVDRAGVTADDAMLAEIRFATTIAALEKALLKQRYREAIDLMKVVLENGQIDDTRDDEDEDDLEHAAVA